MISLTFEKFWISVTLEKNLDISDCWEILIFLNFCISLIFEKSLLVISDFQSLKSENFESISGKFREFLRPHVWPRRRSSSSKVISSLFLKSQLYSHLRVEFLLKTDSKYSKDTGVVLFTLASPGNPLCYNTPRSALHCPRLFKSRFLIENW